LLWFWRGLWVFKNFRNEGWIERTTQNSPLEIYVAYKDYNWMMEFAEDPWALCIAVNGQRATTFESIKSTSKHLMHVYNDWFYQAFYWFWYFR
jgi:lysyl-tRNA synthetase class 2